MKETYKGYEIEYLDHMEVFEAKIGQSTYDNKSLSTVKKYIDNLEKKDFKRVDVIIDDYAEYEFGSFTSCVETNDRYGNRPGIDCWISLKNGSRMKKDIERVYLDNEKNREILEVIKEKKKAISVLEESIRRSQSSFEKYTYEIK